jgi:hypothetical protein
MLTFIDFLDLSNFGLSFEYNEEYYFCTLFAFLSHSMLILSIKLYIEKVSQGNELFMIQIQ